MPEEDEEDSLREEQRGNHRRNGWLSLWAGQLAVAVAVPMIWEGYLESALGWSQYNGVPFGAVSTQIAAAGAIALFSVAAGCLVSLVSAKACRIGTWVWVLPVALLTIAMLWERAGLDWTAIGNEFFYWSHPGLDEGIMMRDLFTYPALSSSCFSIAAVIVQLTRRRILLRRRGRDRRTGVAGLRG